MVAGAIKPPLWVAALGRCVRDLSRYAHGVELPLSADAMAFSMGIVIATGMLHLGSIAFGLRENYLSHRVFFVMKKNERLTALSAALNQTNRC